ncbi:hypothetical protein BY996DRAFT_7095261 [Phakopsora pachyrhizi]|nr:hypothetical protein BY996DRAFT_7238930 [Phakopsora pachyrhizi]KAI8454445.1 hypothetical protein BY996DRAFT_7095261 [Phakopsora pachyrhizi]
MNYLKDDYVIDLARSRKGSEVDSFVHVLDQRDKNQIMMSDREPSSIIFSFLVNSKVGIPVPGTYQSNCSFRIFRPELGFMILPDSLHRTVIRGCEVARKIERE